MKNILVVFAVFLFLSILIGCEIPDTTDTTTLKINNQSFTEITHVIWSNVSFANNQFENSIKTGTSVTNDVDAGAGYIFFKRKSNPIIARTSELIFLEKGDEKEFIFTDNTVIVEVNNSGNIGTLGLLNSTVVWWDDAEGEIQPYFENQSHVGYYSYIYHSLPIYNGLPSNNHFHTPKNGDKSIAVGGSNTAKLYIRINVERNAKLSFWYANKNNNSSTTNISINDITERTWNNDINRSFFEPSIEVGPGFVDNGGFPVGPPDSGGTDGTIVLLPDDITIEPGKGGFEPLIKTVFSINDNVIREWNTDVNWSFMEIDLEPGVNDIVWKKNDGFSNISSTNYYYFLSLDDILIYYTE